MTFEDGVLSVIVSISIAVFLSLISHSLTCSERHACLKTDTCHSQRNATFGCSFRSTTTPAGWRLLNTSSAALALAALGRGVCAPGLRQNLDPLTGSVQCVRQRNYPKALNVEITQMKATTKHEQYCGRWISAQSVLQGETKWAFFDEDEVVADVDRAISARASARVAKSDLARFRSACRSMISSHSSAAAGELAYNFLSSKMKPITSEAAGLRAIGALASFSCETPTQLALSASKRRNGFALHVLEGGLLSDDEADSILYAVGASRNDRLFAERVALAMRDLVLNPDATVKVATIREVVHGALEFENMDYNPTAAFELHYSEQNQALLRFEKVFQTRPLAEIAAYVRAVAASCAFATSATANGDLGDLAVQKTRLHAAHAARAHAPPAGLGRLKSLPHDLFSSRNETHLRAATGVDWSSIALFASSQRTARGQCLQTAKKVFPDTYDHMVFETLIADALYDRLETVSATLRISVEAMLQSALFAPTHQANGQLLMRQNIGQTRMRVAGAPRNSWAGVGHAFSRPTFTSTDGALVMMLKQARAMFLDRMQLVQTFASMCDHPPLYAADERNAYLLISGWYSCAMLLPGILVPPFADALYDDVSLYSRIGYVVAHEFAHVTAFKAYWESAYMTNLLQGYEASTHVEAIADVIAVHAVVHSGKATASEVCASVSQLWCARVGLVQALGGVLGTWHQHSHPPANTRGDLACAFLESHPTPGV